MLWYPALSSRKTNQKAGYTMTRRKLRENIFSILFRLEFNTSDEMSEQIQYALDDIEGLAPEDRDYIINKTTMIISLVDDIDTKLKHISEGWRLERIGKAELAILRLAVYEMLYDEDVPYKVAINEAVELTKIYCGDDARSFVNGLLAKVEE